MTFSIVLLSIFLIGMIGIGIWGMRKTATLNDFFLGGRSVGPWVSAFAYGTTYFSAVLFVGFAGNIGWKFGLGGLWIAFGNAFVGALLAWLVLGRRTRRMTQNLEAMTMPEFLQERFDGKFLKIFAALIIFVFLIPYSASVFKGLGHLFEANFHLPYDYALLIMIGITGVYLIMGGYFAVTLTDFIQGLIMIVGAILMVAILTNRAGEITGQPGLTGALSAISDQYARHVPPAKQPPWFILAGLVFMTSFGVWGLPQMVQKFYAIKNESVIRKAAIVTTLFSALIAFTAYYTGALTHLFPNMPILIPGGKELDVDRMIPMLLTQYLPPALMAVILLLILSASMSTLSSLVLVSASAVAIDLYKGHVNPNVSKKGALLMMRILSGLFVVTSYVIARYQFDVIVVLMSLSWGAVAGAFMAPFFYGLYWKRTTRAGVWAGMITGMILSIVLYYRLGPAFAPVSASIGMVVPFAVIPVVSLLTSPVRQEVIDRAFANVSAAAGPAPVAAHPAAKPG